MRNKLKFGDFIIIGVVLAMAGALAAALTFHSSGDKLYAEVWQNDTLIERVQLTDATDRTIKLDGNSSNDAIGSATTVAEVERERDARLADLAEAKKSMAGTPAATGIPGIEAGEEAVRATSLERIRQLQQAAASGVATGRLHA